jgi:hypothetical protein
MSFAGTRWAARANRGAGKPHPRLPAKLPWTMSCACWVPLPAEDDVVALVRRSVCLEVIRRDGVCGHWSNHAGDDQQCTCLSVPTGAHGVDGVSIGRVLAAGLVGNNTVVTLDAIGTRLHDMGMELVANVVPTCGALTDLAIALNDIGAPGARAVGAMLATAPALAVLDISVNGLGDDGARALAAGVAASTTLVALHARACKIGPAGMCDLAAGVGASRTLTTLDVRNNHIGDAGASALARAMTAGGTLTTVDAGFNAIGIDGAVALANAMATHSVAMVNLDVCGNKICDGGAQALAMALVACRTLATLDVGLNRIGPDGVQALAAGAGASRTLVSLQMSFSDVNDAGAKALVQAARCSRTLTNLWCGQRYPDADIAAILEANQQRLGYRRAILAMILAGQRQSPCLRLPAELWDQVVFGEFLEM